MKNHFKLSGAVFSSMLILFSLNLFQPKALAQSEATKACRLTVVSEDQAIIECISQGAMCSSVLACFRVFEPIQ